MGFHATPFLNTIFADLDGNAWYVDGSAVPNLSEEALVGWELARKAVPELAAAWQQHVAVVDGSSSAFDLVTDDGPRQGVEDRGGGAGIVDGLGDGLHRCAAGSGWSRRLRIPGRLGDERASGARLRQPARQGHRLTCRLGRR